MHIKSNDTVEVIAGDDQSKRGRVLRISRDSGKIVVEGINRVKKHMRRSQKNPQGGILSKEAAIAVSNVLLVCTSCNAATRTGARKAADGGKERFCKKCGAGIGQISPPKDKKK